MVEHKFDYRQEVHHEVYPWLLWYVIPALAIRLYRALKKAQLKPMTGGTVKSEPGFTPAIDATL